eukprot:768802-Hanusia_phi.AAC.14
MNYPFNATRRRHRKSRTKTMPQRSLSCFVASPSSDRFDWQQVRGKANSHDELLSIKNMITEKKSHADSEERSSSVPWSVVETKPVKELNDQPKAELGQVATEIMAPPCKVEACIKTARISDKLDKDELGVPYLVIVLDHKSGRSARRKTVIGESRVQRDIKRSLTTPRKLSADAAAEVNMWL